MPAQVPWDKPRAKHDTVRLDKTLPHRAARRRPGHRLLDLPDLEQLSRPLRQPGHRQRGRRQAAPGRDPARWPSPWRSPATSCRGRLRSQPRARSPPTAPRRRSRRTLVTRPEVGSSTTPAAGLRRLDRGQRPGGQVFTEKAGVNSVVIDSSTTLQGLCRQPRVHAEPLLRARCARRSQNIYMPADGIETATATSPSTRSRRPAIAVDWLLGDPSAAAEVLGAIQNERRWRACRRRGEAAPVLRASAVANECLASPRPRTEPALIKVEAADGASLREMFGPIVYVIATEDTGSRSSRRRAAARAGRDHRRRLLDRPRRSIGAAEATADAGVPLSCNLTGQIFVNQSAAFSDFHVTGANPAGNATLCDSALRRQPIPGGGRSPAPAADRGAGPCRVYEFDGLTPVVDPTRFVHPTAVLIGDVIVGPAATSGRAPCCAAISAADHGARLATCRTTASCTAFPGTTA